MAYDDDVPARPTLNRALDWERPNPSRLNDTQAIVRRGVRNDALETSAYCRTEPFETPWIPENAFNRKMLPAMGMSGLYGCGMVGKIREPYPQARGGGADRNGSPPGNGGSLAAGIAQIKKSSPRRG
jgi:hypothetical protein